MFNEQQKKESPILGMLGMGGGIARAGSAPVAFKNESDTYGDAGRFTSYTSYGTVTENDT